MCLCAKCVCVCLVCACVHSVCVRSCVYVVCLVLGNSVPLLDPVVLTADTRAYIKDVDVEEEGFLNRGEWLRLARLAAARAYVRVASASAAAKGE